MTQAAWEVLKDCTVAVQLLEDEVDLQKWRIHWVAAVSLVRSVGYVLDKVDGDRDPRIRKLSKAAYAAWKGSASEHEIFREFIDCERHNILKEYKFNYHPLESVDVAVEYTLRPIAGGEEKKVVEVYPIGENIYRPITDGFREGDDARDVMAEAIEWWQIQLTTIDESIGEWRKK